MMKIDGTFVMTNLPMIFGIPATGQQDRIDPHAEC